MAGVAVEVSVIPKTSSRFAVEKTLVALAVVSRQDATIYKQRHHQTALKWVYQKTRIKYRGIYIFCDRHQKELLLNKTAVNRGQHSLRGGLSKEI